MTTSTASIPTIASSRLTQLKDVTLLVEGKAVLTAKSLQGQTPGTPLPAGTGLIAHEVSHSAQSGQGGSSTPRPQRPGHETLALNFTQIRSSTGYGSSFRDLERVMRSWTGLGVTIESGGRTALRGRLREARCADMSGETWVLTLSDVQRG